MRIEASDRSMLIVAGLILVYIALAVFAPAIAPYDPGEQNLTNRLKPPLTPGYLLGTDGLGRDILSRAIFGARVSIGVGSTAMVLSAIIGTILGLFSGYYSGLFDDLVSWLVNAQLAFPFILLAMSVIVVLGSSLVNIILVLVITGWPSYTRIIRSKVLTLRDIEFVEAALAAGASGSRIMFRHILPNVANSLIVLSTLSFARMVIAEAALSFLGLGPGGSGYSSWGLMLAEGKNYVFVAWWVATIPGLMIMTMVLAVNIVGDWLRDKLDPKLRTH